MLRKLVKPVGGLLMGWAVFAGPSAEAQTTGYVAAPMREPPPAVSLGYAEPTTDAFASAEPCPPGLTMSADYLIWWLKAAPAPGPLVTSGSLLDPFPAALGQANTVVVYGQNGYSSNAFNGLRLNLATWINESRTIGWEVGGFALEHRSVSDTVGSTTDGAPFLARPFFNTQTGQEGAALLSFPGLQSSLMNVASSTRLSGWDFNALFNGSDTGSFRADALVGVRTLYLTESLAVNNTSTALVDQGVGETALRQGERLTTFDRFETSSNFYGGQIGGRFQWLGPRWITTATVKLAVGVTDECAQLSGLTSTRGGGPAVQGGFLVNGGNGGRYYEGQFAVVPEFGLNVGYRIGQYATLRLGYTALYWSDVARPGDIVPHAINPAQVPGLRGFGVGEFNQPRAQLSSTDFWAQGVNLGIEFRF